MCQSIKTDVFLSHLLLQCCESFANCWPLCSLLCMSVNVLLLLPAVCQAFVALHRWSLSFLPMIYLCFVFLLLWIVRCSAICRVGRALSMSAVWKRLNLGCFWSQICRVFLHLLFYAHLVHFFGTFLMMPLISRVLFGWHGLRVIKNRTVWHWVLLALATDFCWVSRRTAKLAYQLTVVWLFLLWIYWFALPLLDTAGFLSAFSFFVSGLVEIKANNFESSGVSFHIVLSLRSLSLSVHLALGCVVTLNFVWAIWWFCCCRSKNFFTSSGEAFSFVFFRSSCWKLIGNLTNMKVRINFGAFSLKSSFTKTFRRFHCLDILRLISFVSCHLFQISCGDIFPEIGHYIG